MTDALILPPSFDAISAWGIGGLAVVVAIAWVFTWSAGRQAVRLRLALGALVVMTGSAVAAAAGLLQRFDVLPPPMAIMIASVFALAFVIGLSPFGRSVAAEVPL